MRSRIRIWLANLTLAATATVVTLLAVEMSLRATGHRMVFPQMYVEDPHTVYRLKPDVRVRTINAGYFDYVYTVDRRGFRTSNPGARKAGARKRLLFVGDSFTFGVGVDDSATYPARVEARLRQWCATPVDVVNAGTGGFGTSHELSYLQHYGWQLDPDFVVVGFLTSDPQDNALSGLHRLVDGRLEEVPASQRPGWGLIRANKHVPGYNWLTHHSTLFNWVRLRIGSLAAQRAAARQDAASPSPGGEAEGAAKQESERWDLTAALFERVRAQADSHSVRLIVAIIPHGATLATYYANGHDIDVDRMLKICRDQNLACVNVPDLIKRSHPTVSPTSFYLREGHFNARGYDLVANAVATRLASDLGCNPPGS